MGRNQPESPEDLVIITHPQAGDSQPMPRLAAEAHAGSGWTVKEVTKYALDATYDDAPTAPAPAPSWAAAQAGATEDEV